MYIAGLLAVKDFISAVQDFISAFLKAEGFISKSLYMSISFFMSPSEKHEACIP